MLINGLEVDGQGRCIHYRSEFDVVANKCQSCGLYWACHACHEELAGHPFGRMDVRAADSVLCGECGYLMGFEAYSQISSCPSCSHPFNPGCSIHKSVYFKVN
ncbi:CHY zinc finger protein [Corynebacterium alimapuense]|uniref:CHY-type domain-containing protein n=1 Tax=Corynebacterium alimapuense TaxID=1576874 RepID=A0A3M8K6Y4_9CORY|nr:CHY zinc finger protein [Corynebacterium alimapuense]RNE48274.1 hypothetical protein C5L39_09820 [Corynebacterium alimapuense]